MAGSDHDVENDKIIIPITPDPSRVRMEIDELLADNAMTNLYLLALEAMQIEYKDKQDWWTFYSLAGIHGLPTENWNGVPNGKNDKTKRGYCKHGSVLFPTWHRVYIYMFEQAVAKNVHAIAAQYTDEHSKIIYQDAANRFRLPYWDPFLPRNRGDKKAPLYKGAYVDVWGLPRILGSETVWVRRPQSKELVEIPNPLYRFRFPDGEIISAKKREPVMFSKDMNISQKGRLYTTRSPGQGGGSNIYGHDYEERLGLNLKIQRQGVNLMTKLWKLLAPYDENNSIDNRSRPWESFASHYVYEPGTQKPAKEPVPNKPGEFKFKINDTSVSLESWHDHIHMLVGTGSGYGGHMADPAVAGFDPIFWLHHCNIDRLLAIYQALYDKWAPTSGKENDSTHLYPFHKTPTDFWASKDVEIKDWTRLGFATPGDRPLDKKGVLALEKYVHEYYSWGAGNEAYPPDSVLEKWPKDLSGSEALHGPDAKTTKTQVQFETLQKSTLVTRSIATPTLASPQVEVNDELKVVVVKSSAKDTSFPGTTDTAQEHTWNAGIRVLKFAFDGSFNIHLFIGDIKDTQPERYITKKNEVGFTGVFASTRDAPCANCLEQREQGFIYEDAIPVTSSLYEYLVSNTATGGPEMGMRTLESLHPNHVVPFLKKYLCWVVTNTASQLINDDQELVKSKLEILVSSRAYDLPTSTSPLGLYYPSEEYPEITAGKVGGYGYTGTAAA